uniref:TBC domain-containing kinase (Incomplete catalytic triad), putative n=1 Tax=Neospora caninum (strain Liverpool) TaxID=572307 RepID=A0A0F7ULG9_NEOCL|nr:TPA: TBC domain-containing kinase (incomplete catalytic triad), putative [Neospora caninum Liverpool]
MEPPPACESYHTGDTPGDDLASLCSAPPEFLLGFQTFSVASDLPWSSSLLQASSCVSSFIQRGTVAGVRTRGETPLEALLPGPILRSHICERGHIREDAGDGDPVARREKRTDQPAESGRHESAIGEHVAPPGNAESGEGRPSPSTTSPPAAPSSSCHSSSAALASVESSSQQNADGGGFLRSRGAQKNDSGGDAGSQRESDMAKETDRRHHCPGQEKEDGQNVQGREEEEAAYRQVVTRFQFLKQLRHPHLCVYTHILRKADRFFVVSEYWSLSLADLIYQREQAKTSSSSAPSSGPSVYSSPSQLLTAVPLLPEAFLRRVASQILSALVFLNEQGLTHGRLCPSTVRFTASGDVRLSDWGLSYLSRQGYLAPHTRLLPSPPFLTPQQALFGSESARLSPPFAKDDTWALGAILLQAAQGPPRLAPGALLALLAHADEEQRARENARRQEAETRLTRVNWTGAAREVMRQDALSRERQQEPSERPRANERDPKGEGRHGPNRKDCGYGAWREGEAKRDGEEADDIPTWAADWEREVDAFLGLKLAVGPWDDWAGCERRVRGEGSWRLARQSPEEEQVLPRLHPLHTLRAVEHAAMMLLFVHWAYEDRMHPHFESLRIALANDKSDKAISGEEKHLSDACERCREARGPSSHATPSFSCIGRGIARRLLQQKENFVDELRHVVSRPCCLVEPEAYASLLSLISTCLQKRRSERETGAKTHRQSEGKEEEVGGVGGAPKRTEDETKPQVSSFSCLSSTACPTQPAFDDGTFLWAVLCSHVAWFAGSSLFPLSSFSSSLLHVSSLPCCKRRGYGRLNFARDGSPGSSCSPSLPSPAAPPGSPLSSGFREFLRRILEINPDRRLSPAEARSLPWVHAFSVSLHATGPLRDRFSRVAAASLAPQTGAEGQSSQRTEETTAGGRGEQAPPGSNPEERHERSNDGYTRGEKRCGQEGGEKGEGESLRKTKKEILMCPKTAEAAQLLLDMHIDEEIEATEKYSRDPRGPSSLRGLDNLKDYLVRHHNVSLEEIFFWWQLRGGDVHTTLVDLGALRPVPPILRLPLCCLLRPRSLPTSLVPPSRHAHSLRDSCRLGRSEEARSSLRSSLCPSVSSSPPHSTRLPQRTDGPQKRAAESQETPASSSVPVSVSPPSRSQDAGVRCNEGRLARGPRAESGSHERLPFLSPLLDFRLLHDQAPHASGAKPGKNEAGTCLCASLPSLLASCSCSSSGGRDGGFASAGRRDDIARERHCSELRRGTESSDTTAAGGAFAHSRSSLPPFAPAPQETRQPAGLSSVEAACADPSGLRPRRPEAGHGQEADVPRGNKDARETADLLEGVGVEDCSFFACGFSAGRNWIEVEANWLEGDARIRGVSIQDTVAALQEADRFSVSQMHEVRPRCLVRLFRSLLVQLPKSLKRLTDEAAVDIPPLLRAQIWATLLGVNFAAEVAAGPFVFEQLVLESLALPGSRRLANNEFSQCYEHHDLLGSRFGRRQLRRLLQALFAQNAQKDSSSPRYPVPSSPSLSSPCRVFSARGLDAIAAPLQLLYMNHPQIALACLDRLLTRQGQYKLFGCDNAAAIEEQLACFSQLLYFFDPPLAVHLQRIGLGPDLYALSWLLTLFAHALDLPQLFLLWDSLLLHPPSFLLFVSFCLLHHLRLPLLRLAPDEESSALSLLRAASAFVHVPALCGVASALETETPVSVALPFLARKSGLLAREGVETDGEEDGEHPQREGKGGMRNSASLAGATRKVPATVEVDETEGPKSTGHGRQEEGKGVEQREGDGHEEDGSPYIQKACTTQKPMAGKDERTEATPPRKEARQTEQDALGSGAVRFYIGDDADEEKEKRNAFSTGNASRRCPSLEQRLRARLLDGNGTSGAEKGEAKKQRKKKKQSLVAAMIQGPANLLMGPPRKPRQAFDSDDEEHSESVGRSTASPGIDPLQSLMEEERWWETFEEQPSARFASRRETAPQGVACAWSLDAAARGYRCPPFVSVDDLVEHHMHATVLDVRPAASFRQVHFINAKNVAADAPSSVLIPLLAAAASSATAMGAPFPASIPNCKCADSDGTTSGGGGDAGTCSDISTASGASPLLPFTPGTVSSSSSLSAPASRPTPSLARLNSGSTGPEWRVGFGGASFAISSGEGGGTATQKGEEKKGTTADAQYADSPDCLGKGTSLSTPVTSCCTAAGPSAASSVPTYYRTSAPGGRSPYAPVDPHATIVEPWLKGEKQTLHLIVVTGSRTDAGVALAARLQRAGALHVCVLRGGIDAVLADAPVCFLETGNSGK